jgi:hypothetical protein
MMVDVGRQVANRQGRGGDVAIDAVEPTVGLVRAVPGAVPGASRLVHLCKVDEVIVVMLAESLDKEPSGAWSRSSSFPKKFHSPAKKVAEERA